MSFAAYKKSRTEIANNLVSMLDQSLNGKKFQDDDQGYWKPTLDKAGTGWAIIRFLPSGKGETLPYAEVFSYSFKGPNGWYIEKSRASLGENDPAAEFVSELWNSGKEDEARKYPRRRYYHANIMVVDDPGNPENNGKVFLFRFPKQILEKINQAMNPKIPTMPSINAFDMMEGADFTLVVERKKDFPNYENSTFEKSKSPVAKTEKEMEAIYNQCRAISELLAPDQYKPYDQLAARLHKIMGLDGSERKASKEPLPTTTAKAAPVKAEPVMSQALPEDATTDLEDLLNSLDNDDKPF